MDKIDRLLTSAENYTNILEDSQIKEILNILVEATHLINEKLTEIKK